MKLNNYLSPRALIIRNIKRKYILIYLIITIIARHVN